MKEVVFLLMWTAHWQTYKPCPAPEPYVDPFSGRTITPQTVTLLACFDSGKNDMQKEFSSIEELKNFMSGCQEFNGFGEGCSDWKAKKITKVSEELKLK